MKSLVAVFIYFTCVSISQKFEVDAWTALIPFNESEAEAAGVPVDSCYTTQSGVGELKIGQTIRLKGSCALATCQSNRNIDLLGCGVTNVPPPCYTEPGNLSDPYPECCVQIKCP